MPVNADFVSRKPAALDVIEFRRRGASRKRVRIRSANDPPLGNDRS
jgi:hypothetical protein